ncbi:hypothetical protein [Actinoplanes sp. ATCC 53533]|nr:hypothetical protein [Actinoplanes sp. ATCC 53533]
MRCVYPLWDRIGTIRRTWHATIPAKVMVMTCRQACSRALP